MKRYDIGMGIMTWADGEIERVAKMIIADNGIFIKYKEYEQEIARLRKALDEIDCECHRFEPISTIPEIENIHDLVIEALAPKKEGE